MKKPLFSMILIIALSFSMFQTAFASSDLYFKLGQNEDGPHISITEDGVEMFPVDQIFKFVDPADQGGEYVNLNQSPWQSSIVFQNRCFVITRGSTEINEMINSDAGCFEVKKTYTIEKPARYLDDPTKGVLAPLSFISKVLSDNPDNNFTKFETKYDDNNDILTFTPYTKSAAGTSKKQIVNPVKLAMKINSPWLLTADDGKNFDDNDHSVTPVIRGGSTLLPIAPVIQRLGGTTTWNEDERKVTISLADTTIDLWIDLNIASVNGVKKKLEVAPTIINGRTMTPLRFVTENLGATVSWDQGSQMILLYYGGAEEKAADLLEFSFKIGILDATQKSQDNRKSLVDIVSENQKKHDMVQYNDNDPLDYYGNTIHVGDTVMSGTFYGVVKKIDRTKVLVYWNRANYLVIGKGEELKTAALFGIDWLGEQWFEAKTVTVSN
ncbi:copper amine oxidase N-terminal domain-containing protein [Paenibacillus thalictri]|uniref:Copper amine oxidase N-terminal domain-containing protein n=1 Tax=Paenibacillus thalictri TaxID=2527873 RepID=A0A4Q9DY96_9BACL|nr:copper amine oxidase N-terminal domain-containing protein [Paenibacillus thalictri]TBL80873.1 copper amine oxidase N-terminal domain-containing protein [Paenibacillus thalictri]